MISLFVLKPRTRHRNQKPPTQAPPPHPITLSNCGVCAHASSSSSSRALRRILSRCTEALEVASTSAFLRTRWEGAACTSILWLPLQTLPQSLREQQEIERLDDNDGLLQTLILLPRGGIGDAIPTSSMTVSRQISIFCIYIRSACILDLSYTSWVTKVLLPINIINQNRVHQKKDRLPCNCRTPESQPPGSAPCRRHRWPERGLGFGV